MDLNKNLPRNCKKKIAKSQASDENAGGKKSHIQINLKNCVNELH